MKKTKNIVFIIIGILLLSLVYELVINDNTKSYSTYTKIEIPISQYDFGTIKYLDTITYSFKIKNIGDELLLIDNISTISPNVNLQIKDSILPPSYESEINIKFIAQNSNIGFNKIKISIRGNFENKLAELNLTGIVSE